MSTLLAARALPSSGLQIALAVEGNNVRHQQRRVLGRAGGRRSSGRARRPAPPAAAPSSGSSVTGPTQDSMLSEAEKFVLELSAEEAAAAAAEATAPVNELEAQLVQLQQQVGGMAHISSLMQARAVQRALPACHPAHTHANTFRRQPHPSLPALGADHSAQHPDQRSVWLRVCGCRPAGRRGPCPGRRGGGGAARAGSSSAARPCSPHGSIFWRAGTRRSQGGRVHEQGDRWEGSALSVRRVVQPSRLGLGYWPCRPRPCRPGCAACSCLPAASVLRQPSQGHTPPSLCCRSWWVR